MTTTLPSPKDSRQPEGAAGLAAPYGSASWGGVSVRNSDCMEAMREYPDAHFDIAICDPPYGIGWSQEFQVMSAGIRKDGTQRKMKEWNNPRPKQYASKQ